MNKISLRRVLALLLVTSMLTTVSGNLIATYAVTEGCTCGSTDGVHTTECAAYVAPDTPVTSSPPVMFSSLDRSGGDYMSAIIYADSDYTSESLVLSATETNALEGWAKDARQYLLIGLTGLNDLEAGEHYQLVVSMDEALYASTLDYSSQPWVETQTIQKNGRDKNGNVTNSGTLPVNKSGTYPLNAGSATATYDIVANTVSANVALELNYDWNLWNREAGYLGYGRIYRDDTSSPLLKLQLLRVTTEGTETVKTLTLDSATTNSSADIELNVSDFIIDGDPTTTINVSQVPRIRLSLTHNIVFWDDLRLVFTAPSYTDAGGNVYSLEFEELNNTNNVVSFVTGTNAQGQNTAELTLRNYYSTTNLPVFSGVKLPATAADLEESCVFSGGTVQLYVGDQLIGTASLKDLTMIPDRAWVTITTLADKTAFAGTTAAQEMDYVQFLGMIGVANAGSQDSGDITLRYEFNVNNQNHVGVTAIRLMMPKGSTATVDFTMTDFAGNTLSGQTTVTHEGTNHFDGVLLQREALDSSYHNYYFKTITYSIQIPAGVSLYNTENAKAPTSAGTIWGKVLEAVDVFSGYGPHHQLTVYDGAHEESALSTATVLTGPSDIYTAIQSGQYTTPYGLQGVYLSNKTVAPGESTVIRGEVSVSNYPFQYRNVLGNIRLGLRLPAYITINESAITATLTNSYAPTFTVTCTPIDDGTGDNFWMIQLEEEVKIGYFGENPADPIAKDETSSWGGTVSFAIPIDIGMVMGGTQLALNDRLFVAGYDQPLHASGIYAYYKKSDLYDMLNPERKGGDKEVYISGMSSRDSTVALTITPPKSSLEIDDAFLTDGDVPTNNLTLHALDQNIRYQVTIDCTHGGSSLDFYIPVPKATVAGLDFVTHTGLSLKLTGAPTIQHSQGSTQLKVLYTTQTNLTYETAASATWKEATEITAANDWSNVTLMKVTPADPGATIQNGSHVTITPTFQYDGDEALYARNAGTLLQWKSKGRYTYYSGSLSSIGDYACEGVSLTLNHTTPVQQITLTAAKEDPLGASLDLNELIGGNFFNRPTFTIRNIETEGDVTLVGSDTDFSTMGSVESNTKFAITAKLNDETAKDLLVGNTVSGFAVPNTNEAEFIFNILNGNVITENATSKKVTLDLVGSNGITVPVEITIVRKLTSAEPGDSGILGGKNYTLFTPEQDSIDIAESSAFTAQFVTTIIPTNYTCPEISFGDSVTRRVILIDWTTSDPSYYWATVSGSVSLNAFDRIDGDANVDKYIFPDGTEPITQRLLFIVDEAESSSAISLTQKGNGAADIKQTLTFNTVANRTFGLTGGGDITIGDSFTLNFSTTCAATEANDSFYQNRALSLVLTGSGLPEVLLLKVGETTYNRNVYGQYIIPLGDIQEAGNGSISITAISGAIDPACTLEAQLYVAGASNGEKPLNTEVAGPVTITISAPAADPGFKVLSMSDRIISTDDLGRDVTVSIRKVNLSGNATVTMAVQVKDGGSYVEQAALLDSLIGLTATNGDSTLTLRFRNAMAPGTYRLLFTVTDGNVEKKIPYNFIVVD